MEGISDIKIVGVDAKRPPVIRKQPYIDLFFELSHKVPAKWSADFNSMLSKVKFSAKVNPEEGLYVETWVRLPDDVETQLAFLKTKIVECNEAYIARVLLAQQQRQSKGGSGDEEVGGEQGRLNGIVAGLKYDA